MLPKRKKVEKDEKSTNSKKRDAYAHTSPVELRVPGIFAIISGMERFIS